VKFNFEVVKTRRILAGKCPECGKRVQRSRVFKQAVNPFNRNKDGSIKSYPEVRAAVNAEANAWVPDFTHDACAEQALYRSQVAKGSIK